MGKEGGRSVKRAEPEAHSSGCISSFFHLFDFHPLHFSFHPQPQPSSIADHYSATTTIPRGTEAPRNSLESVDSTMVVGSISKTENLENPKNKLFIKTSTTGKVGNVVNDLSPGTKTPTLVARLMGLDLLPETSQSPPSSSPSSSSTTTTTSSCLSATKSQRQVNPRHHHHLRPRQNNSVVLTKARHSMDDSITVSRFLPETPRISSARRSDVEHRLSLQINKENMGGEEFLELPRFSFSKLKFEEQGNGKSPRQYAKQIVKQMRESVLSRKVGSDVTNTVKNSNNREKKQQGEFVVVGQFMRSQKSPRTTPTCSSSSSDELITSPSKVLNNNPPSCSPRFRFMDPKNKLRTATKELNSSPKPQEAIILVPQQEQVQNQKKSSPSVPKCNKKSANEKFSARLKKQDKFVRNNKQDESFVRPLLSSSSDIKSTGKSKRSSHHSSLINLLDLNKVQNINIINAPAAAATKIPQEQTLVCGAQEEVKYCSSSQLSSGSSQTYAKEMMSLSSSSSCVLSSTTTGESNVAELDKRKISVGSMFSDNGPQFEYVSSILSRTGFSVKKGTPTPSTATVMSVSLFHPWLSPTQQPLDYSIFHQLEQQFKNWYQGQNTTCDIFSVYSQDRNRYDMGVQCNRRLLFDLVNETLLELEVVGTCYDEEALWERIIGRFERSNKKCEVLEDIDALIDIQDMGLVMMKKKSAVEMGAEIEGNIMDTLLHETVIVVTDCCGRWYGSDDAV